MSLAPLDTTLTWCIERLSTANVNPSTLTALLGELLQSGQIRILEDDLRLRLYLHNLSKSTEINYETLEIAEQLKGLMLTTEAPAILGNRQLPKPGELNEVLVKIKTELVVNTWRDKHIPPRYEEIRAEIDRLFGSLPEVMEESKYMELCSAAINPGYRESIAHYHPKGSAHRELQRYVSRIQDALGPTLLEIINSDIKARRYVPGLGGGLATSLASPLPQQGGGAYNARGGEIQRQGIFQDGRIRMTSHSPRQLEHGQSGRPKTARNLNQAMNDLHEIGGQDPLAHAQEVAAGAAETLQLLQSSRALVTHGLRPSLPAPGGDDLPPSLQMPIFYRSAPPPLLDRRNLTTPANVAPGSGGVNRGHSGVKSENNRLVTVYTNVKGEQFQRRHTVRWLPHEVEDLLRCCDQYGPTSWARMKHENPELFANRTQVDLKDKWRNLLNSKDQRIRDRCAQIKKKWMSPEGNFMLDEALARGDGGQGDDEEEIEESENEGNGTGPGQGDEGEQNIATKERVDDGGGHHHRDPGPSSGRRETRSLTKKAAAMEVQKWKRKAGDDRDTRREVKKKSKGSAKK